MIGVGKGCAASGSSFMTIPAYPSNPPIDPRKSAARAAQDRISHWSELFGMYRSAYRLASSIDDAWTRRIMLRRMAKSAVMCQRSLLAMRRALDE